MEKFVLDSNITIHYPYIRLRPDGSNVNDRDRNYIETRRKKERDEVDILLLSLLRVDSQQHY